jgi:flavin-dependent dehydrogenase
MAALLLDGVRQRHGSASRSVSDTEERELSGLSTDACVIGGGPAGAAVALRLARLGYRVCVVERRGATPATRPQESLAPSIAPLLDALGVLFVVERSGLLRMAERRLSWAGDDEEVPAGRAWLIDRPGFDRLLVDAAVAGGAEFMCPARARRPEPIATGWKVPVDGATGRVAIKTRFLVDASGRRTTRSLSGPLTCALHGRWRGPALPASPEMRVEAGSDAWFWGAPFPDGSFSVLAFLDSHRCAGLDNGAREALYRGLLDSSALLKAWMLGGLVGQVRICDATWRVDPEPVTISSIKIGDRFFAMDPLASQGVHAALRSAVQASAVIHTILSAGDAEAAIEFYRQAQREAVFRHRRTVTGLYKQRLHASSFWHDRSQFAEPTRPLSPTPVALLPERRLRLSPEARIADLPVIDGTMIRRYPALAHPALDRPVAWLGSVALGLILSTFATEETVAALLWRWSKHMTERTARQTLSWLMQRRIVVDAPL